MLAKMTTTLLTLKQMVIITMMVLTMAMQTDDLITLLLMMTTMTMTMMMLMFEKGSRAMPFSSSYFRHLRLRSQARESKVAEARSASQNTHQSMRGTALKRHTNQRTQRGARVCKNFLWNLKYQTALH